MKNKVFRVMAINNHAKLSDAKVNHWLEVQITPELQKAYNESTVEGNESYRLIDALHKVLDEQVKRDSGFSDFFFTHTSKIGKALQRGMK